MLQVVGEYDEINDCTFVGNCVNNVGIFEGVFEGIFEGEMDGIFDRIIVEFVVYEGALMLVWLINALQYCNSNLFDYVTL